jgi:hypothetical protein
MSCVVRDLEKERPGGALLDERLRSTRDLIGEVRGRCRRFLVVIQGVDWRGELDR